MEMTVYDFLKDPDLHPQRRADVQKLISEASQESHQNARNYDGLFERLHEFDSFTVLEIEGRPVAFSGLWNPRIFSADCARALTRTYYHPSIRNLSMISGHRERRESVVNIAIAQFLPWHVRRAALDRKAVFISLQGGGRRRAATAVCQWIRQLYPDQDWQLLPRLYNTCRQLPRAADPVNRHLKCWQNIIILSFDNRFEFSQPSITVEDWKQNHATTKCASL